MNRPGLALCLAVLLATAARAAPTPVPPPAIASATGPAARAEAVSIAVAEDTFGSPLHSGLDVIEQHFITPMPRERIETEALAALLQKLDPYSRYLDAAAMDLHRTGLDASFGGIGVNLGFKHASGYPSVEHLLHGGAAGAAGIRRGDLLVEIGGIDLKGKPMERIPGLLRGTVGSVVTVRVRRENVPDLLRFELRRVAIQTPSVRAIRRDAAGRPDWWLDRERRLGYARVSALATDTAPTMARVLDELRRGAARGLVLDLRDCTGGIMHGALQTADLFLDRGRLLTIRQRGADRHFDATRGKVFKAPLVILINQGTASSGEILAGALADNGRGTLVGERSFGKGRIQTIYTLGEGRGGMVMSTGTFQRPNGKTIDKHEAPEGSADAGIVPQVEVKMSEAQRAAWLDFTEVTTGTLVLTPEEQRGAPPDPVLEKAIELLTKR